MDIWKSSSNLTRNIRRITAVSVNLRIEIPIHRELFNMARGQAKSNIKKNEQQSPAPKDQGDVLGTRPSLGKQPQGISKQQIVCKSARLQAIRLRKESTFKSNLIRGIQILPSPLHTSNIPIGRKVCSSIAPHAPSCYWPDRSLTTSTGPLQTFKASSETEMRAQN